MLTVGEGEQRMKFKMANQQTKKCAHLPCLCDVRDGEEYCGETCRDAGSEDSRVNATICHVRSRFGSLNLDVPLIWPAETIVFRGFTCATREVFAGIR